MKRSCIKGQPPSGLNESTERSGTGTTVTAAGESGELSMSLWRNSKAYLVR
jgi:hypothetical protein